MRRVCTSLLQMLLIVTVFALTGCGLSGGSSVTTKNFNEELQSATGKWLLKDDTDTYFEFDGAKNVMTFKYIEDGADKYSGIFSVEYRGNGKDIGTTMTLLLTRSDSSKGDAIYAYADDFDTDFTQFSIIKEERDEGMNDGRLYAHVYRISELPYKMGTYILEGNDYKQEKDNYYSASTYQIPEGTYRLGDDTYFTFVMPKPYMYALFRYQNGNEVVEGVYWTSTDKKTIYIFTEHDPYQYIRKEERKNYDMTFSHDYPPDFYLRGDFDATDGAIVISDLYHHEESQTSIKDSVWKFGTYIKTGPVAI